MVHALAVGGSIPVVATVRDGEAVPGAITALWKDAGLTRIDLRPLSRPDTEILTSLLLGGDADVRTLGEIWRLSRGHPLELRELILSARDTGTLAKVSNLWMLDGSFNATPRLVELVDDRLGRLDEYERAAAETLAYGAPLDLKLLAGCTDREAIASLERSGVIRVLKTSNGEQATMAHPLYGEVLRATLPAVTRSKLADMLANASTRLDVEVSDPLRIAVWRLESGEADAEELETAAIGAVRRMAWDLTLRFATASLDLAPSYMGHGCLAAALAELGDPEGAEAHLVMARDLVDDPAMYAWNTISVADVWFYHAGRMEDALELVRKELAQTRCGQVRLRGGHADGRQQSTQVRQHRRHPPRSTRGGQSWRPANWAPPAQGSTRGCRSPSRPTTATSRASGRCSTHSRLSTRASSPGAMQDRSRHWSFSTDMTRGCRDPWHR